MVLQWVMSKERDHFTKFMALKTFFLHLNLHVIKKNGIIKIILTII